MILRAPTPTSPSSPSSEAPTPAALPTGEWDADWTVDRAWVERALGAPWGDALEFYGRLVGHVIQEATPVGDFDEALAATLREAVRANLPRTLEEVTPFAVRQVWNRGLQGDDKVEARRALLSRIRGVSLLAGAAWSVEDLERDVAAIMA